ncbi:MAG TPA: dihydrofolate reductase family protein [Verrucomicrobiae bacterium]|nr:dihydrofolate reductase family protein [Verrucomicrobiae bacterium]
MSKLILNMTMSLDGFTAGPNIRPEEPMGDGGEELHRWMFAGGSTDENPGKFQTEFFENIGAYIMGRRTLDLGLEPWGENPPYHAPCFVLSKERHDTITKQGGTSFAFVTDGVHSAFKQAQAAAGSKDIIVMGGANAAQQFVNAGLFDELYIHVAHMLLGSGTRLFDNLTIKPTDLEKIAVTDALGATHMKFRFRKLV